MGRRSTRTQGRRSRKQRKTQDKADRKDRQAIERKKQAREEKLSLVANLKKKIRRHSRRSRDGLARQERGYGTANEEGIVSGYGRVHPRWEDCSAWVLRNYLSRKWEPNKPLTALEKLARCAGGDEGC